MTMDRLTPQSRASRKLSELGQLLAKEDARARYQLVSEVLKIPASERTDEQNHLLEMSSEVRKRCENNNQKREMHKERQQERHDSAEELEEKCLRLSLAIHRSQRLVVYTGAGISTAAQIPDYRGPNGVWTRLDRGQHIQALDLSDAEPTYTHMALAHLSRIGKLKRIVSQNCDGLHVRSGLARDRLSELHGNMFLEVCPSCPEDQRENMRLFDVTEKTAVRKHGTTRKCRHCDTQLRDTIVHFGEKGGMESPYHWEQARAAAESADIILCLGTSLKVLRKYACLWCMDRPKKSRPPIFIVNLQWTPKDDIAELKIHGYCDDVMSRVMNNLGLYAPNYHRYYDPIFQLAVPLLLEEEASKTKKVLMRGTIRIDHDYIKSEPKLAEESDEKPDTGEITSPSSGLSAPGWYGKGCKRNRSRRK